MSKTEDAGPTLDPQCRAVLDAAAAAGGSAFEQGGILDIRAAYDRTTAAFAPPTPALSEIRDLAAPGTGDQPDVPLRLYRPENAPAPAPCLIFLHGGGWAVGNVDTHDAVCRALAHKADMVVISVDYRLAPEHKFPAAPDDCEHATRWIFDNADQLGLDRQRIALGGDSAGGNLTAAVTLRLRDKGGPGLLAQVLIYPSVDFTAETESLSRNGDGYLLTARGIADFRDWYLNEAATEGALPDASPLLAASHADLPPAFVQVAGFDPLRDEGLQYAERLRAAGAPTRQIEYPGMLHGFLRMGALINMTHVALDDIATFLRQEFRK